MISPLKKFLHQKYLISGAKLIALVYLTTIYQKNPEIEEAYPIFFTVPFLFILTLLQSKVERNEFEFMLKKIGTK